MTLRLAQEGSDSVAEHDHIQTLKPESIGLELVWPESIGLESIGLESIGPKSIGLESIRAGVGGQCLKSKAEQYEGQPR